MKPELAVRSMVHRLGFRFRLHKAGLPGKPDLVFASKKKVVFVHGCFWHSHPVGCQDAHLPKSNRSYWLPKLARNKERDSQNEAALSAAGWGVLTVWECELKDTASLLRRLASFLGR